MKKWLLRQIAVLLLTLVYGTAFLFSKFVRKFFSAKNRKRRESTQREILVIGTFHNPNWFFAHVEPIVRSSPGRVTLICDDEVADLPGLKYRLPPKWMNRIFTRAGAKTIIAIMHSMRHRPDICVGYHIFPAAVIALVCARLGGGKAVFQVTSGPLELEGGGWHAENRVLVSLGYASAWVEKLALAVTREFELAVVRGSQAESFLLDAGFSNRVERVTGSVDNSKFYVAEQKDYDMVFVGRLEEYKRPDRLMEVMRRVASQRESTRLAVVGDGSMREELEQKIRNWGLADNVEFLGQQADVMNYVARSKLFILTSRWEGVSIAMLEAMMVELVPIVSDVGDLRDFARNDETGYCLPEDDLDQYATKIVALLENDERRQTMAKAARQLAEERCSLDVIVQRWQGIFESL